MDAIGIPRSTRPCLACARPVALQRLRTNELAPRGWRPSQVGSYKNWCGHDQVVVPVQGPDGLWALIPLVGTASSMTGLTIGTPAPDGWKGWAAHHDTVRDFGDDPALKAEMERLQAELAEIEALGDPATCRICGGPDVTIEHAPSQASGNRGPLIGQKIDPVATRALGHVVWMKGEVIGGSVVETLCVRCNNNTGRRFNPAYLAFEKVCRPLARPEAARALCSVRVARRPLVAKQVLTWIVATSHPGFTARYPMLRTLLQKTGAQGPIAPLRLWCHLMANGGTTWYSGITPKVNALRREGHLMSSFASSPLGWILTIGNLEIEGAHDVSSWTELDKRAKPVTIQLPCQWRLRPQPDDFRSRQEILAEAAARAAANQ